MAAGIHPAAGAVRVRSSKCRKSHVWLSCLVLTASLVPARAYEADPRYIFISSPEKRSIYYAQLPAFDELSKYSDDRVPVGAQVLIDGVVGGGMAYAQSQMYPTTGSETEAEAAAVATADAAATTADAAVDAADTAAADAAATVVTTPDEPEGTLLEPQGLAMWHGKDRAVLYVADSKQNKIFSYQISANMGLEGDLTGTIQAGSQHLVAKDIEGVSGIAVDGFGNVYFSTTSGKVGKYNADQLNPSSPYYTTSPVCITLYDAASTPSVQEPKGLAADNFNLYWSNQANGQTMGAIVSAFQKTTLNGSAENMTLAYPDYPKALAKNAAKAEGVCIARNNVFFTGDKFLYGVKTIGGTVTEVYAQFDRPRGCAYDGEGTLYVADEAGYIYSLPANYPTLRSVPKVQMVVGAPFNPQSVAVFTRAEAYMLKENTKFLGIF